MTFRRLLLRNLVFHRRAHLAILLGVAVGSAVLTGALLVGDSLRDSLRERAELQRCGVDLALVSGRFFNATPSAPHMQSGIILHGSVRAGEGDSVRRLNGVTVLAGFDLTEFAGRGERAEPTALPAGIAGQLGVHVGDSITLRMLVPATVPAESLLGQRDLTQTTVELTTTIRTILDDDHPACVFRLQPGFVSPRNIVVPIAPLQEKLARYYPQLTTGTGSLHAHNAVLAAGPRDTADAVLRARLRMADFGLKWGAESMFDVAQAARSPMPVNAQATRLLVPKVAAAIDSNRNGELSSTELGSWFNEHGYVSLESHQGIIDATTSRVALETARSVGLRAAPTLVYLATSLAHGERVVPYSVVASIEPQLPPPLGPFLPPGVDRLGDDEIMLLDWPQSPLRDLPVGAAITVVYFKSELQEGRFVEDRATFKLRGYLPPQGAALDPYLTPAFAGVTDRLSVRQWSPPFPYDNERMGPGDERYWREYRTIPKAFVNLNAGRRLWSSRYGDTTSVRIAPPPGEDWAEVRQRYEQRLVAALDPAASGLAFDDLKARFDAASQGGQDFGGLFLGFSFFLIVSALLLVGLLTRLNLERRAGEIGLLLATGWRLRTVRSILLLEMTVVAMLGGVLGVAAAVGYGAGMLWLLRELWPDVTAGSFLRLHVSAGSLASGYVAALFVSGAMILVALRWLGKVAPSALLAGQTQPARPATRRRVLLARIALAALVICVLAGLGALGAGGSVDNPEMRAMTFFGGGALLLTAALMLIWRWLTRESSSAHMGQGPAALARLGARNARRNPSRSLLTAGLLASAAFLLVAVESFRRRPEGDFLRPDGGSGGCPLVVETTLPVVLDLNGEAANPNGRLQDTLQQHYQRHPRAGETPESSATHDRELLQKTRIYSFRKSAGDDASCLNLYQAGRPQVLGVPNQLIHRGGFRFVQSEARTAEERANPWLLLQESREDGAIPIVGEQNTIMWMLKKGLGDELSIPDESGQPVRLRIVGILKDSVFQSEILMSAENAGRVFPHIDGFTFHLVEAPAEQAEAVADVLRLGLARYEPEVTRSADRVAAYMAVENTYLTTFQLLGGFGLLLGALGLVVVMLRNVWERRSELALLRAVGYRHRALGILVLAENALLLALGLAAGVGTAALSVLPHLALGGTIPWPRLTVLLAAVVLGGLLAGALAVRSTLRAPLLPALRKE